MSNQNQNQNQNQQGGGNKKENINVARINARINEINRARPYLKPDYFSARLVDLQEELLRESKKSIKENTLRFISEEAIEQSVLLYDEY